MANFVINNSKIMMFGVLVMLFEPKFLNCLHSNKNK